MNTTVTLFLPDLFPPHLMGPALTGLKVDALMTLLSRATCLKNAHLNTESTLKSFFSGLSTGAIPAGPLGALAQGIIDKSDTGWWCQATPVECQVDQKAAYVLGNQHIDLTFSEIATLVSALQTLFEQDGLQLKAFNSHDWFCSVTHQTNVVMNDLAEVLHKNMGFLFPSGPDEIYWRKLLTECQMLLAQNAVNLERAKQHKPLVSSLWFWGLGKLPSALTTCFDQVLTNDSVIQGLAKMANVPALSYPKKFEAKDLKGHTLFADTQFCGCLKDPFDGDWMNVLLFYESNLFYPLLTALKDSTIAKLRICTNDGREFIITQKHLKYFWRRIITLDSFIG